MGKYSRQWVFIGSYCPVCHLWHTAILESKCWKSAINWGHSQGDHHNICNQYKPSCTYHEQGCNTFIANPGHTQMAGVNAETFKQKWKEAENMPLSSLYMHDKFCGLFIRHDLIRFNQNLEIGACSVFGKCAHCNVFEVLKELKCLAIFTYFI